MRMKLNKILAIFLTMMMLNGCTIFNKQKVTETGIEIPVTYDNVRKALVIATNFRTMTLNTANVLWREGVITKEAVSKLAKLDEEIAKPITTLGVKLVVWYDYIENELDTTEIQRDALNSLFIIILNSNELKDYFEAILTDKNIDMTMLRVMISALNAYVTLQNTTMEIQ